MTINATPRLDRVYYHLRGLGLLAVWGFLILSTARVILFFKFGTSLVADASLLEIAQGFLLGLRYDGVTLVPAFALPLLLLFVCAAIGGPLMIGWLWLSRIWFFLIFVLVSFLVIADLGFFQSFDDHLNSIALKIFTEDLGALVETTRALYPLPVMFGGLALLAAVNGLIVFKLIAPMPIAVRTKTRSLGRGVVGIVVIVLAVVLVGRGAVGKFPLRMQHAAYSNNEFLNILGPNGVYTLQKAIKYHLKGHQALRYWKKSQFRERPQTALTLTQSGVIGAGVEPVRSEKISVEFAGVAARAALTRRVSDKPADFVAPHVVIIVVESLAAWPLDLHDESFQIAPGYQQALKDAVYFPRFFSNGVRTIGSLDSLFLGIPSIGHGAPISETRLGHVPYPSALATVFAGQGHQTSFVYSGKLTRYRLDRYLPQQGFQQLIGQAAYGDAEATIWGVHDETLYRHIEAMLQQANTPQMITALTTTNHPPFSVPNNYTGGALNLPDALKRDLKGGEELALGRFRTYQYSVDQLVQFVARIRASSVADDTIIVAVGDHNFESVRSWPTEELAESIRVPLLMWLPDRLGKEPGPRSQIGSHVDISATLFELALSDFSYSSMGRNLLDQEAISWAYHQMGFFIAADCVLRRGSGVDRFYHWQSAPKSTRSIKPVDDNAHGCGDISNVADAYLTTASLFMERGAADFARSPELLSVPAK